MPHIPPQRSPFFMMPCSLSTRASGDHQDLPFDLQRWSYPLPSSSLPMSTINSHDPFDAGNFSNENFNKVSSQLIHAQFLTGNSNTDYSRMDFGYCPAVNIPDDASERISAQNRLQQLQRSRLDSDPFAASTFDRVGLDLCTDSTCCCMDENSLLPFSARNSIFSLDTVATARNIERIPVLSSSVSVSPSASSVSPSTSSGSPSTSSGSLLHSLESTCSSTPQSHQMRTALTPREQPLVGDTSNLIWAPITDIEDSKEESRQELSSLLQLLTPKCQMTSVQPRESDVYRPTDIVSGQHFRLTDIRASDDRANEIQKCPSLEKPFQCHSLSNLVRIKSLSTDCLNTVQPTTRHPSIKVFKRKLERLGKNRGSLELDKLLGIFSASHISTMTLQQLKDFEKLLSVANFTIFGILSGQQGIPKELHSNSALPLLLTFINPNHPNLSGIQ